MQQEMQQPKIDLRLLTGKVLIFLILPVTIAFLLDLLTGLTPLITIGFCLIFFPLAGFVVIQTALAEMDRIIQIVAPDRIESDS